MIWIATACAALCGFLLPFGLGAFLEYRDTGSPYDGKWAGIWLGASILLGVAAVVATGFVS